MESNHQSSVSRMYGKFTLAHLDLRVIAIAALVYPLTSVAVSSQTVTANWYDVPKGETALIVVVRGVVAEQTFVLKSGEEELHSFVSKTDDPVVFHIRLPSGVRSYRLEAYRYTIDLQLHVFLGADRRVNIVEFTQLGLCAPYSAEFLAVNALNPKKEEHIRILENYARNFDERLFQKIKTIVREKLTTESGTLDNRVLPTLILEVHGPKFCTNPRMRPNKDITRNRGSMNHATRISLARLVVSDRIPRAAY